MKNKPNVVALVGALLCLASLLFPYVSIELFIVAFGIKWVNAAQYTNYVLYVIPVIGVLLLLGGLCRIRPLLWGSVIAAVGIGVYYIFTYRNVLNGDMLLWMHSTNVLLGEYVDINDLQQAIEYLKPFLRLGSGAWIYLIGCLVSLVGVFVDAAAPDTSKKSVNRNPYDSASENGGGSYY